MVPTASPAPLISSLRRYPGILCPQARQHELHSRFIEPTLGADELRVATFLADEAHAFSAGRGDIGAHLTFRGFNVVHLFPLLSLGSGERREGWTIDPVSDKKHSYY